MDDAPTLVMMAGLPGSGKSTLASVLGRRLSWPVLDQDTVKTCLLALGAEESLAGPASYQVLFDLGRDLVVQQGRSIILDSPSIYPRAVEVGHRLAADSGGRLRMIFCSAGPDLRAERIRTRPSRISQPGHPDRPEDPRWRSDGDGSEFYPFLPSATLHVITDRPPDLIADDLVPELSGTTGRAG